MVRGLRVHHRYSVATQGGGTPVVCVHGLAVSHRYLVPLARHLARTRPVYLPDLPGFGLSAKPSSVYDAAQHAGHLAAWLEATGLPPACVLGHSFGAEVAAALAAHHPHTTAALVLAGPTSDPAARSRRALVGRFLRDVPRESKWQAPILVRDVWDAGPARVWATLSHSVRNRVEEDLAEVTAPTLVIRGARDPISPASWTGQVARLSNATHATIPHAPHNVTTTAAPQVAALITQFLLAVEQPA
jgi:pimeloyl-ACP methyl ester carboxylesterase